ncbi:DUF2255 family protein [Arthrobacter gyeryongensis]|uniref:DUF2255 family protein n=1 Tax=Arthrobacter gyeryongensis TaxID=1650592 RepID=A0ABP9S1P7_9MICC
MTSWTAEQLEQIGSTDDFHISPYRDDGTTPGTPTRIWAVVVDIDVYVRPYNGTTSRWRHSAMKQGAGWISAGGIDAEVSFTLTDGEINDRIDAAYAKKYAGSPYLPPMISTRTRTATMRVDPRKVPTL